MAGWLAKSSPQQRKRTAVSRVKHNRGALCMDVQEELTGRKGAGNETPEQWPLFRWGRQSFQYNPCVIERNTMAPLQLSPLFLSGHGCVSVSVAHQRSMGVRRRHKSGSIV